MNNPITIGIIGDGQLAKMIIQAGEASNIKFNVLPVNNKIEYSICRGLPNTVIMSSYDDLFKYSDQITYEYEHLDVSYLQQMKYKTTPSLDCLEIIMNKLKQKEHYQANKFNVPVTYTVGKGNQIADYLQSNDQPNLENMILKSCLSGYNGSGVIMLDKDNYIIALDDLKYSDMDYILEEKIDIKDEVAVMVAINNDNVHVYEPVYMKMENQQLEYLKTPLHSEIVHLTDQIKDLGLKVAQSYQTNGLFGIEFFVDKNDKIYVNEVSPRPHNSGHHTIDNSDMSQYEALLCILTDTKFRETNEKPCCMMNLLGNDFRGNYAINRSLYKDCYDSKFKIHLYGKKTHFPERKLGHMTKLLTPEEQKGKYIYYNHNIMRQLFIPIHIDIVMGSISDGPVVQKAVDVLDKLNIGYSKRILSAHRMPYQMVEYAKDSNKNCVKVIIACAGGAAHLPGMIASMTVKPVIGLPAKTTALNGLDSLYSIVQMPKGVPVATVAIDNGENAALLACRILALQDDNIRMKLVKYHQKMNKDAIDSNLLLC